ncbi:Gfo/Idh/MocA family protein [Egicoccus sp. AB-alg2]|uniref:Gfo/Idh/MocA family protein n=1 Tax=Egicoccus sp. AB-alg2 TaxID=3242693 RepID=UPI00359D8773
MSKPRLGIAMIGYAFMGRVHSQAWRSVNRFFDLPAEVDKTVLCGRSEVALKEAAATLGWAETATDWRALLERDDIDVIDICTPGSSHAEIAVAALEAGKHVLCEKPLANTLAEAEAMTAAADAARGRGVRSMVGFNYRRVPALAFARQLIADGRLGTIRHVRAHYLQDWIVDPDFPLVWRLRKEVAGSGALGDIGAHIADLAQYLVDDHITEVTALMETFVRERPLAGESSGLSASAGGAATGEVTVDDAALFLARFGGGAIGTFEATRFATGRKNAMGLEINGARGSIAFDFESMNELWFHDHTLDPAEAGARRILVTEETHPYLAAWWPPGHVLGYEHTFTHEMRDFVEAVATGVDPRPSFADGLQVQRVLDAVETSAAEGRWQAVER